MKFLFIFFSFFFISVSAQEFKNIGMVHLNNLASDEMFGRGYVNNGYEKAVAYVEKEFKNAGLISIGDSYRQSFNYPVNTFPDSVCVSFNSKKLIPGKDFIVSPESGSDKGTFKPIYYEVGNFFMKNQPVLNGDEILVVEPLSSKMNKDSLQLIRYRIDKFNSKIPVIELTKNKLTWSVGGSSLSHARIEIKAENFDTTVKQISLDINSVLLQNFQSYNVVGCIKSKKKKCKDYLVITAHLDHLGMMGSNAIFNGANDNASGVSMLLTLANHYSKNAPNKNILFIAFGGEEAGLIGSKYFVDNPLVDLKRIKFLMNIDLMGNGVDGITVVNATKFAKQYEILKKTNALKNYLKEVKPRGEAANSDHYWFTQKNIPSFFIYTLGGTTAYHDVFDRTEQLPMTEFDDLCRLVIDFFGKL